MQPELGLIDTVRMSVGTALQALGAAAESHPFYLCGAFLAFWIPLLLTARVATKKHRDAGLAPGAAWLTSALVIAAPLLAVFLVDKLLYLIGAPTLESRVLEYFSPRAILASAVAKAPASAAVTPAVARIPQLSEPLAYPAAAALCLFGTLVLGAYVALYGRGGIGVSLKGEEAGGWMRMAGHWGNRGAEKRFGLWAGPLARNLLGIAAFAAPAAIAGHIPPLLWIVALLVTHGWMKAAQDALEPKEQPEEEGEEGEGEQQHPQASAAEIPAGADTLEDIVSRALEARCALVSAQEAAKPTAEACEAASSTLFAELLAGMGVGQLYRHQAQAVGAFLRGANVLLCTPPGSGRAAIRDALAMHAALAEGVSVLFVCRSAEEAEADWRAFRARSEKAHWRWNVPALVLSGREGLDLDRVQPSIVFASWDDVHARLLPGASRFGFFLRSLRLVAVSGLERYQGPSADHLAYLLARLRRVCAEAAGPASLASKASGPRLLAIADPVGPDVVRLAERVAAEQVVVVGEESDGAPAVAMRHVWLTRPDGSSPAVDEIARELERTRTPWCAVGLEAELGARGAGTDPRDARALVVRAEARSVAQLPLMLRHYGSASGAGSAVVAFWLVGEDPLSRRLPGAGKALREGFRPPRLVIGSGSQRLARDHAACAVAEAEWPVVELEAAFGAEPAREALEALKREGPVVVERRPRIDADSSDVEHREVARAHKARPHKRLTMGIVGQALRVEDRSTGRVVLSVSAERALAAAFPERIIESGARRYRMLPVAEQRRREEGVLWAESETRAIATVPVRRIELEPQPERRHGERRQAERESSGTDRRTPARRALAGLEFSLSYPRARIRERIEGFRTVRERAVADAGSFPEVIDGVHEGRAAILGFPGASGWEVTPAGLHALAHLFRAALPAVLQAGPDDLDVADLSVGDEPSIAFVDLHPGGGGYAEAVSLDAVRALAKLSLAVVRGCGCRKSGGCPDCVRVPQCHARSMGGEKAPSRREAERLLCQLLDPALIASGDAVVYEDGKAPASDVA